MAEPLNRLISSTQTIGGAASIAGTPSPITPVGAAGIGANQDAAKMAGTPNQKQSALVRNLRETRSEVDQAAFMAAASPKKSKTAEDLARAAGLVDKVGSLANRVGEEKVKATEEAAVKASFPTAEFLTPTRMQTVFPGLPQATADEVSTALAVFMDGATLNKNDPRLQEAARTLSNAKKPDGSPLFPPDILQSADAMRKLVLPPEAINMTQSEMADEILSRVNPELQLADLNSPSFLEAVGGPGYTEQEWQQLVQDVTGKAFDGSMSWGEVQAAFKSWQTSTMTDYNALQDQARSSNENVAGEAQQRLRELGFFGGQTHAEKIQSLDIDKADDVAIPGTDATLDDVLSGSPKGKQALIDVIVQGEKDPTFFDSLPGNLGAALKAAAERARSVGQITPEEIAGVAQTITGDAQTRKGYTQYTKEDGTPQDFTPLQLQALADLGITFDPRNPVPASMVQNPFFRMLSTGAFGRNQSLVVGLLDEAKRSPALMEFLRTADEGKIRNSRMFTDPTTFKNELIQAELLPATLKQAKAGNSSSRAELFSTIGLQLGLKGVNNEQSFSTAIKDLVQNGVTSINGVKLTKTVPGPPATTVPLSPMEMADLLVGSLSQQTVVDGRVSTLQVVKDGVQAAVDKASAEKDRRANVEQAVKAIRHDLKTNAGIKNNFGQAKATADSLKADTGLMLDLGRIFNGTLPPHNAHKRAVDLANKVTGMQNALAAITGMPSYASAQNDPQVKADIAALRRQISEAQAVVSAIASITSPKGGKMPDLAKLPAWIRSSPQFTLGQRVDRPATASTGGKGGGQSPSFLAPRGQGGKP